MHVQPIISTDSIPAHELEVQLLGNSHAMTALKKAAQAAAAVWSSVMIVGESGTGKESLARFIHQNSRRAPYPFIPVDCSALPEECFERELFGGHGGASSGARRDSLGCIRASHGGTLFLNALDKLSPTLLSKILCTLRKKSIVALGGTVAHAIDVRLIAATTPDMEATFNETGCRNELYLGVNTVVLKTPPLRERPEDILPLARHFLALQAQLFEEPLKDVSDAVSLILQSHAWPGNIRELAELMQQVHVLASGSLIELRDLPKHLQNEVKEPAFLNRMKLMAAIRH